MYKKGCNSTGKFELTSSGNGGIIKKLSDEASTKQHDSGRRFQKSFEKGLTNESESDIIIKLP